MCSPRRPAPFPTGAHPWNPVPLQHACAHHGAPLPSPQELTLGIQFLSSLLETNAGGPNLKLGSLNALLSAIDPATPANGPIQIGQICGGALAKFGLIKGEDTSAISAAEIARIKKAIETDYTPPAELPCHRGKTALQSFAVLLRRMRHQKVSSLLVPLAGEACAQGDAALFGMLLDLEGRR